MMELCDVCGSRLNTDAKLDSFAGICSGKIICLCAATEPEMSPYISIACIQTFIYPDQFGKTELMARAYDCDGKINDLMDSGNSIFVPHIFSLTTSLCLSVRPKHIHASTMRLNSRGKHIAQVTIIPAAIFFVFKLWNANQMQNIKRAHEWRYYPSRTLPDSHWNARINMEHDTMG